MQKQQLLDSLRQEGIEISNSQIRRYISDGLIQPVKESKGRGSGVRSVYSEITLKVVYEIVKFSSHPKIRNQQELIYVLFVKGYPVNFTKLRDKFISDFNHTLNAMRGFASFLLENQDEYDWFVFDFVEKSLPRQKPGRPSGQALSDREKIFKAQMIQTKDVFRLFIDIATDKRITLEKLNQIVPQPINDSELDYEDAQIISDWLSIQKWEAYLRQSTIDDFEKIQNIIKLLIKYLDVFLGNYSSRLGSFDTAIKKTKNHLNGLRLIEIPVIVKMIVLILLVPEWRSFIHLYLSDSEQFKKWSNICQEFSFDLNNGRG